MIYLLFRPGLSHHAFIHHDGVTHKCMTFLQHASDKVDAKTGTWRSWYDPLSISRASERCKPNLPKVKRELIPGRNLKMEVDESQFEEEDQEDHPAEDLDEDMQRVSRNVDNPLDQREGGLGDKIDSALTPGRKGGKGSKGGKEKGKEKG